MTNEFKKRLLTSIFLLSLLILAFIYSFILLILLILISVFSWIEFSGLINRIINKDKFYNRILRLIISGLFLFYIFYFSTSIFVELEETKSNYNLSILYLLSVCIFSDIGGYIFGKTFKGKKLTKISPNKTVSGSVGSFIISLCLVPLIFYLPSEKFNFFNLIIITIIVSLTCQLGDLFISYLKRKAKVKDTGDLLPGHGGILDRIDGILFALPFGIFLWKLLII